jgi:predicted metal-dependent phosphoesterase TrpH
VAFLELHLHTKAGSADSSITADALGERAAALGTGGLVVTEHFRVWADWERDAFEARWGVRLYPAVEVTTNRGHVIVIGAEHGERLPGSVEELLDHAAVRGHTTIWAHPFRHYFDAIHPSQRPPFAPGLDAARLAEDPALARVDAVEAVNAACTARENALAAEVGRLLGKPLTRGSDAHDLERVGAERIAVPALPADVRELADLVRSMGTGG